MSDATKIHRGPVKSISIDAAGGSAPTDLGYLGNNNVEISFEKRSPSLKWSNAA